MAYGSTSVERVAIKFGMDLRVTVFGQVAHAPLPALSPLRNIASGVRGGAGGFIYLFFFG